MKKRNVLTRSKLIFGLAFAMLFCAIAFIFSIQTVSASEVVNKTATIKTTLDTRISKELGNVGQATIEFDLFSSDLKSEKNLAWCNEHVLLVDETSVAVNGGTQTLGYTNPSVVFALDSYSPEFDVNMLTMLTNTVGDTMRVSKSIGFEYQANGIIRNFSRFHWINGGHRRNYALTEIVDGQLQWNADSTYLSFANTHPAGPYYYGDISEVKNFLNAGYSYKIEQFIGIINSDGTITYGNTMCQDGHARENYSLAVFKKAIGATEWQLSFGWYLGRDDSYSATFAGMEIISGMDTSGTPLGANTAGRGQYRPDVYNTITMEIDNLAIYANRNKVDADVIVFDDVANEDFYLNDEVGVTPYLGAYSGSLGQCFGWPGDDGWDFNVFTQKGVKFNLVNTAPGYMATFATCNLNEKLFDLNKTAIIKTTLDTRISKEIGNVKQATIEFDLINSDLKSEKNLAWCNTHVLNADETLSIVPSESQTLSYTNPSVIFALDSNSPNYDSNMFTILTNTVNDTIGIYNSIGFEYQANGIIRVFNRSHMNAGGSRKNYALTEIINGELQWNTDSAKFSFANTHPIGPYYYGDIKEVKDFLNPGYSYKIEQFIGRIDANGNIVYGATTCQDGYGRENYWLAVFKKPLGTEEWELSFGWYLGRTDSELATYAGMEIISGMDVGTTALGANTNARGQYRPEVFNTITMEIDNLAIYANRNKSSIDVVNFDYLADDDFYLNDEVGITEYLGSYSNSAGQCFGWPSTGSWDLNTFNVDGINFTLANTAPAYMATFATASLKSSNYKNVKLIVDGELTKYNVDQTAKSFVLPKTLSGKYEEQLFGWLGEDGMYKPGEIISPSGTQSFTAIYGTIENFDKASVRVKDNEGIRFMSTVSGNLTSIDNSYFVYGIDITDGDKKVSGVIDKTKVKDNGDGSYSYYSVLTGLESNEETVFMADANVTINCHDGSTLTFSAKDMADGRSYIYVVTAALLDVQGEQDDRYAFEIKDNVYSCYREDFYQDLLDVYSSVTGNDLQFKQAKTWDYDTAVAKRIQSTGLGDDVMPIMGFWGPYAGSYYNGTYYPDLRTPEIFDAIADAGINITMQCNEDYSTNPDAVIQSLINAQNAGISVMLTDVSLVDIKTASDDVYGTDISQIEQSQSVWDEKVAIWNQYESFAGLYVRDEPVTVSASSIGKAIDKWNTALVNNGINPEDKYAFVNLFPYAYIVGREGTQYSTHIDQMVNKGKVDVIMYDYYPFEWPSTDNLGGTFYVNMVEAARKAKEHGITWMSNVQVGGEWVGNDVDLHTSVKWPTEEQLLWEVNNFIALGAKGLDYFTLCQPHSYNHYMEYGGGAGLFDPAGNKTYLYYAAQQANKQILASDHMLMNATNHGVISKGKLPGNRDESAYDSLNISSDTFRELIGVSNNCTALIGCFDVYGKTMLWVVNSSYYEDTEIELTFDNSYAYDVVQGGSASIKVGNKLKFNLSAGEAAMVALR